MVYFATYLISDYLHIMQKTKNTKTKSAATKTRKKKFRLLTDEEMIFGFGPKPTGEQLEEYFSRPDGKGAPLEVVRKRILKKLKAGREDK